MTSKEGANDKRVKNKRLYKEFELRKNFLKMFGEELSKKKEEDLELSNEVRKNKIIMYENKFNSRNIETDPYSKRKNKGSAIEKKNKKEKDVNNEYDKKEDVVIIKKEDIENKVTIEDSKDNVILNSNKIGKVNIDDNTFEDKNNEIDNKYQKNIIDTNAHMIIKDDSIKERDNSNKDTNQKKEYIINIPNTINDEPTKESTIQKVSQLSNDKEVDREQEKQTTLDQIIKPKTVLKTNPINNPPSMIPNEPSEEAVDNIHNRESSEQLRKAYRQRNVRQNDEQSSSKAIDDNVLNSPTFPNNNRPGFGSLLTFKQVSDTEEENNKNEDEFHQTIKKEGERKIIDSPFHERKKRFANFGIGNKKPISSIVLDNKKEDSGHDSNELVKGIEAIDEKNEQKNVLVDDDEMIREEIEEIPRFKASRPKKRNIVNKQTQQEEDVNNQEEIEIKTDEIEENSKPQSIQELRKNKYKSKRIKKKENQYDIIIPINNKEQDNDTINSSNNDLPSSNIQPLNTNRKLLPQLNQVLENEPECLINTDTKPPKQDIDDDKPSTNPLFTSQPHKSAIDSIDVLSPIKPPTKDQFIFPYETYIEVLDNDKSPHIIPLSLLRSSQESSSHSSTIEDSVTGQIFTFSPSKFNPSNELSHVLILKDNEGISTPIKKMYLRSLIDKVTKCEPIKEEEEILDTSFNRHFIPKTEVNKLVNNSRLAECVTENESNPYIEVYDLKGNNYELERNDFKRIFDNINKGNAPLKKEKFKTSKGESIMLNPFTLRPHNVKSNEKVSVSNSKSRKSSVSSKTPLQTSFMTMRSNIKDNIPYTFIDSDQNSYYKVTNLLSYKQDFLSKQKIMSIILSKDSKISKMYNKDELKLIVNKNNSRNEYIKLPSNKFIKKHHIENLLNSLVENKLVPLSIQVLSHNGEVVNVDTKSSLISLYEITPSPYMKDEILHISDITYYYDPSSKNFIKKDSSSLSSLISNEDLSKPGIELFEFIKVEDVQSIPLFIRKPFIRHQLYNDNITANIDLTDIENHNRVISMISIISKFTKLDVSTLSQTRINDPIPNCMIYYDVNEVGNTKLHLTAKDKIKLANRKLKNEKTIAGINLVDVKGRVFNALIDNHRISLYDKREWVQVRDENGEDIYLYKSVIRHILDDDDENSISCYRAVTTNSERGFDLNKMMNEKEQRVNTMRENNNLLEEEEDIVNVVDYYCKRKRISRKAVRKLITNYYEMNKNMNTNNNSVVVQQLVAKKN